MDRLDKLIWVSKSNRADAISLTVKLQEKFDQIDALHQRIGFLSNEMNAIEESMLKVYDEAHPDDPGATV